VFDRLFRKRMSLVDIAVATTSKDINHVLPWL
jgi:hypothetical protein